MESNGNNLIIEDWQSLVNKPVYSSNGNDIGIVRSVQPEFLITSYGSITQDRYLIPKSSVQSFKNAVAPGPEPRIYHPIDWFLWHHQKEEYQKAQTKLAPVMQQLHELEQRMSDLDEWSNGLVRHPETVRKITSIVGPFRFIWNTLIAPVLHLTMLIVTLRFGIRLFLRIILIKGLVPSVRV